MGLLPACSYLPEIPSLPTFGSLKPYRIDIQQGNFLSQEMVSQLKKGMTREQVRFVLGTPLVTDIFHADRWDYVFYRELPGDKKEQRNISVFFVQDKLDRVAGDVVPKAEAAGDGMPKEAMPATEAPKAGGDPAAGKPETRN